MFRTKHASDVTRFSPSYSSLRERHADQTRQSVRFITMLTFNKYRLFTSFKTKFHSLCKVKCDALYLGQEERNCKLIISYRLHNYASIYFIIL